MTNKNRGLGPMARKRILHRRAPPIVTTLAADMVEKPESKVLRKLDKLDDKSVIPTPTSPELITTVLSRAEPRTDLPISAQTTVQNHPEADTLPRINPPRVALPLGIGLLESRTSVSQGAPRAVQTKSDIEIRTRSHRRSVQSGLKSDGAPLSAGHTHLFRLPNRGVTKEPSPAKSRPSLLIQGDQAVRLTFLDGVGAPIQDLEFGPSQSARQIAVPSGTKGFATIGLGGAHQLGTDIAVGAGAITSRFSTGNQSGVGFLAHSSLVQSGPIHYLCRGGNLEVKGIPLGAPQKMSTNQVLARNALKHSTGFTITLPSSIQTFALITRGEGSVNESCKIHSNEHFLSDAGSISLGASRWVHLFAVEPDPNTSKDTIPIHVTLGDGWACDGAVGLQGSPTAWSTQLTDGRWSSLIEAGPLSSNGSTSVTWCNADESGGGR